MSNRDALLVETDGAGGDAGLPPIPDGLSGGHAAVPRQQTREPEPQFDIVETDSQFKPLQETAPPQQDAPEEPAEPNEPDELDDPQAPRRERESKSDRRQRQKMWRERTMRENATLHNQVAAQAAELAQLRAAVQGIEPRLSQFDEARAADQIATIERQIDEQAARATAARQRMARAVTDQDPDAMAAALDERDQAIIQGQRLLAQKNVLSARPAPVERPAPQAQPQVQAPPPPMASAVRAYVQDFADQHRWYNPSDPHDLDSQVALRVDNAVAEDGFDPGTQDYWDELDDRLRRYLPHRFADQRQQSAPAPRRQAAAPPPERRGPMTAGASDRGTAAPSAGQVYLSPERKENLVMAGILDRDGRTVIDRGKFNRVLKQFQDYDRANGIATR